MDYLDRDSAPLSSEEWERLDQIVVSTAKQQLVGRKFIPVFGPFGAGLQTIHNDVFPRGTGSCLTMSGECADEALGTGNRTYKRLPIIHKDFQFHWRDLETNRQFGVPFDASLAAAAAYFVANAEDELIFHGNDDLELEGLLNAPGRQTVSIGNYDEPGNIFKDVVESSRLLSDSGFYGPYALVLSPKLHALATRVFANTGVLELEQIRKIADGGVYRSAILPEGKAVMVSMGTQNMDIAISQDLITAYLDTDNMNHLFRVFEILTLRIKRPGSIVTIE